MDLNTYTASDIHNAMNALLNGLDAIQEELKALREDYSGMRSDLRSVREHVERQDPEIWNPDGLSRLGQIRAEIADNALRVKGLWAVVGLLVTTQISVIMWLLHR